MNYDTCRESRELLLSISESTQDLVTKKRKEIISSAFRSTPPVSYLIRCFIFSIYLKLQGQRGIKNDLFFSYFLPRKPRKKYNFAAKKILIYFKWTKLKKWKQTKKKLCYWRYQIVYFFFLKLRFLLGLRFFFLYSFSPWKLFSAFFSRLPSKTFFLSQTHYQVLRNEKLFSTQKQQ